MTATYWSKYTVYWKTLSMSDGVSYDDEIKAREEYEACKRSPDVIYGSLMYQGSERPRKGA